MWVRGGAAEGPGGRLGPAHAAEHAGAWGAAIPASQLLKGRFPTAARLPWRNPESKRSRLSVCGQTGPWSPVACMSARGVLEARWRGWARGALSVSTSRSVEAGGRDIHRLAHVPLHRLSCRRDT